jgi:NADPH-dependent curcumin reductase
MAQARTFPSARDWRNARSSHRQEILSKSLTLRGFINTEFAEQHYAAFLREVGAGIADGRIRYREDIVDGLEKAPTAFIGMLDGQNFGKLIVRIVA